MDKLISIIVPVYNVEDYLPSCIDSLVNQSYESLEIILVDDGSTDSCPIICDEYACRDSRIKVLHKMNGGLSDARNAGIKVATGELIALVDSDDIIENRYCEKLYNEMVKYDADIVVGLPVLFCEKIPTDKQTSEGRLMENHEIICSYLLGQIRPTAWGKLYKRGLFENVEYPVGKTTEDVFVIVEILKKCRRLVNTVDAKYYYRQRKNSIQYSKNVNSQNIIDAHFHNYNLLKGTQHERLAYERYLLAYLDALNILIRNHNEDKRNAEYTCILRDNRKKVLNSVICKRTRRVMLRLLFFSRALYTRIYVIHIQRMLSKLT